ncbi:MAG: response regulator [Pseudomonadota bacterium]
MNSLKDARILIADDEGGMRNLLASIVKSNGYSDIEMASDGQKALDILRDTRRKFDIAMLDIDMPGFTGIEVMRMALALRPDCFFIIVSAHSGVENVKSAISSGAKGFVVKPYNTSKIMDILERYEREARLVKA